MPRSSRYAPEVQERAIQCAWSQVALTSGNRWGLPHGFAGGQPSHNF